MGPSATAVVSRFRLGRNFSIYAVGRMVAMLISLLLLPVFTRELPPAEFGVIGILWLVVPLLSRAMNLGLDVALSLKYFKLSRPQLALHLYNTLFGITACSLVVLLVGSWRLDWVQTILHPSVTHRIFALLIASIVFSVYTTMMQSFLQLSNKPVHNVVATILPPVIILIMTYFLVTHVNRSYVSYIVGMAIGHGLAGSVALGYFFTLYPPRYFRLSFAVLKQLLRIGLPIVPGTVGAIVLASADRYMIKHFLGLEAVAIYTYGYRFAEYLSIGLYEPFQKALAPIIYERAAKDLDDAAKYSARVIHYSLVLVPLLLALIIVPSRDLMQWLGGSAYDDSYAVFLLAVFGVVLYSTAQINSILLNHLERTELDMLAVLLGSILNIGLNLLLIPRLGIIGAALSTIVSYLFILALTVVFLNYLVPHRIPLGRMLTSLLPLLLFLAGVFYVDVVALESGWQAYGWRLLMLFGMVVLTCIYVIDLRYNLTEIIRRSLAAAKHTRERM